MTGGLTTTKNSETDMAWLKVRAEAVGLIVTLVVIVASISASYGISQHQINKHDSTISDLRTDVDSNSDILIEIRNDVKWLRLRLTE